MKTKQLRKLWEFTQTYMQQMQEELCKGIKQSLNATHRDIAKNHKDAKPLM
jgi:hypothetical protein